MEREAHLRAVKPEHLRDAWEVVLPGVREASGHSLGAWIPEDCYAGVQRGDLSMFLWIVDDRYAGFIVLQKKHLIHGLALHIFALFVVQEYGDCIDANMHKIDDIARHLGARKVTFQSPRKGWERRCSRLGFEPVSVNYEREV